MSGNNPSGPHTGHDKSDEGDELVKGDRAVKGNVLVEKGLAKNGDQIAAHRQQDGGKGEHQDAGRATSHSDAVPSNLSQTRRLIQVAIVCKTDMFDSNTGLDIQA